MKSVALSFPLLFALGCSSATPAPVVVRVHDTSALAGVDVSKVPVVVEFMPGDEIPFVIKVDGELIATAADQQPVPLTAKRHFFLRISKDGLATSLDNVDWTAKPVRPGSFALGVGVDKKGPLATLSITTPKHAEPAPK